MKIVPVGASLSGLPFAYLSNETLRLHRTSAMGLVHADDPRLPRATRVDANFAESVPPALALMFLADRSAAGVLFVHAIGAALAIAWLSHACGMRRHPGNSRIRIFGMATTLTVLPTCAGQRPVAAVSK
jgi:uncharacterized membrane protein YecN with MAPEG domain